MTKKTCSGLVRLGQSYFHLFPFPLQEKNGVQLKRFSKLITAEKRITKALDLFLIINEPIETPLTSSDPRLWQNSTHKSS